MLPQQYNPIPLSSLNPYETHRAMVALVTLLGSLGPFDTFSCSLRYTGGEGWSEAMISHYGHGLQEITHYRLDPLLSTDPVSGWLTAQNAYALAWHQPSLFPAG